MTQKTPKQRYSGETVWITGASSGIGAALAHSFAREGAVVILSARRRDALMDVARSIQNLCPHAPEPRILGLDVTEIDTLAEKASEAASLTGRIDWLINNAGISQRSLCVDTSLETYRTLFEVDVFGQIALTKAVLPYMLAEKRGHIAVTASVAGKVGIAQRTGYCAAKHAVMGFFDALRSEVSHQGIEVTTITPGFIRTNISVNALKGDGSLFGETDNNIAGGMSADACAEAIMRGFKAGKREIAVGTGKEMHALWIKRFLPGLMFKIADKVGRGS